MEEMERMRKEGDDLMMVGELGEWDNMLLDIRPLEFIWDLMANNHLILQVLPSSIWFMATL